jgi:hypothetical protein
MLNFTRNLSGDILELGVAGGESLIRIKKWQIKQRCERNLFGFDSYEGYPVANIEDGENWIKDGKPDYQKYTLAYVRQKMTDTGLSADQIADIKLIKGWIPESFRFYTGEKISLINLDLNLYQPIIDSLNYFWDKMEIGGVILLDEYDFGQDELKHPGAKKAIDKFARSNAEKIHKNKYGKSFFVKF